MGPRVQQCRAGSRRAVDSVACAVEQRDRVGQQHAREQPRRRREERELRRAARLARPPDHARDEPVRRLVETHLLPRVRAPLRGRAEAGRERGVLEGEGLAAPPREREGAAELVGGDDVRGVGRVRGARCGGGGVQRGLVVVVASLVVVPRGVELKVAAARVGGGEELSRAQRKLVCHLGAAHREREQDGRVRRVDADEPSAKGVGQPRRCGSGAALLREGGLQQPRGDEEVVRAAVVLDVAVHRRARHHLQPEHGAEEAVRGGGGGGGENGGTELSR
mmetsp:Transcript_39059/g.120085  ORF Transcript_39059/g.120085 Transcript_39059/m.120085 type:complete len:278 (-) Transcript_39059:99-932(-)